MASASFSICVGLISQPSKVLKPTPSAFGSRFAHSRGGHIDRRLVLRDAQAEGRGLVAEHVNLAGVGEWHALGEVLPTLERRRNVYVLPMAPKALNGEVAAVVEGGEGSGGHDAMEGDGREGSQGAFVVVTRVLTAQSPSRFRFLRTLAPGYPPKESLRYETTGAMAASIDT